MKLLIIIIITLALISGAAFSASFFVGESASYRYKLTLSVSTPDGVKSASSVGESIRTVGAPFWNQLLTGRPYVGSAVYGEGLYIDLGPGRRPMVALISWPKGPEGRWNDGSPTDLLNGLTSLHIESDPKTGGSDRFDGSELSELRRLKTMHAIYDVDPRYLPTLITFADTTNPNSIVRIDPNNLEATLGPGVKWRSHTLQVVDEPLTKGLEERLPWLKSIQRDDHLDGSKAWVHSDNDLLNRLIRTDIINYSTPDTKTTGHDPAH